MGKNAHPTFRFQNLGPVKDAELELGDLTIITGRNNAGKTYIAYALYGFLRQWPFDIFTASGRELLGSNGRLLDKAFKSGTLKLSTNPDELRRHQAEIIDQLCEYYSKMLLPEEFSAEAGAFENVVFSIDMGDPPDLAAPEIKRHENPLVSLKHEDSALIMSVTDVKITSRLREYFLASLYVSLLFPKFFQDPFILTNERFGIALFQRDLDFAQIELAQHMRSNRGKEGNPYALIKAKLSRFAHAVQDNISHTRSIPDIVKRRSDLYERKRHDDIKRMMQGYYKVVNGGVRFVSRARKEERRFDIPLYQASASARGLSDMYFYLRHAAKTGQLLIIDEPETHLDAANQVEMARLLARLARSGVKVLITTHSDYIVKEINCLIMLSRSFKNKEAVVKELKYGDDEYLEGDQVRAYVAEKNSLTRCEMNEYGIEYPFLTRRSTASTIGRERSRSISGKSWTSNWRALQTVLEIERIKVSAPLLLIPALSVLTPRPASVMLILQAQKETPMNRLLSWISALLWLGCVSAASGAEAEPSPYISRLSLPDGAKMRIGKGRITRIAYSPDSRRIAAASSIGVWIYNAGYGKEIALLRGHNGYVTSTAYSPNGTRIISSSSDNTILIWNAETGTILNALNGHTNVVHSTAYSPDGKTIVSGGRDNTIRLWNANDGALLNTLEGHMDDVNSTAYSPDGKTIVSGSDDGTARIWDAESGALLRVLEEHADDVNSTAYSPDGKTIVSGSDDGTARIWDAESGALLHILEKENKTDSAKVRSVAYSMDGRLIASGGIFFKTIEIGMWYANGSPRSPFRSNTSPNYVAFSPDGHNLASGNPSGIYIWNIEIGERIHTISGHDSDVDYAMFTPDGTGIAAADWSEPLRVWDLETGELLKSVRNAEGSSGAFSPDGRLAAAAHGREMRIIDVETDSVIHTLKGHAHNIEALTFSPDSKAIASVSADKTIRIWDAATGAPLKTLEGHASYVHSAAYSPDSKAIVSASADKTIRIWDAATGAPLKTLEGHTDFVYSAAYSPDGKAIVSASADKTVRIWDAATGAPLKTLEGHTDFVLSAAYSPDGNTVASGSRDNTVRIWDAAAGALLKTLEGHTRRVKWVGYSPDGKTLASASMDGTVLIWDVSD